MKVLIVYEQVPEETKIYSVEVSADEWSWMKLTHGHFLNTQIKDKNVEAACHKLWDYIEDRQLPRLPASDGPIMLRFQNYDYILHTGEVL